MLYALVSPTGEVIEYRTYDVPPEGTAVVRSKPRLLPVQGERPDHDPRTQVVGDVVIKVGREAVTQTWPVRDKTADELAADILAAAEAEALRINAERDRRKTLPFAFDFGDAPTFADGASESAPAGVRQFATDPMSLLDLMALHGRVTAGATEKIKVRSLDNRMVYPTPEQFLAFFDALALRNQALMEYGVQRKTVVRSQGNAAGIIGTQFSTDAGWPS